jgi:hypothetical protein
MKNTLIQIWKNKGKIAEGVANSVFKKAHVEEIADERMKICMGCPFIDHKGTKCAIPGTQPCCGACGCSLHLKQRSLSSFCDEGKWGAVLTHEEEDMLKKKLNEQE